MEGCESRSACDDDDASAEGLEGLVEHADSRALDFKERVLLERTHPAAGCCSVRLTLL